MQFYHLQNHEKVKSPLTLRAQNELEYSSRDKPGVLEP